ncbi:hypothetical protein M231_02304 [Tremella mesenterica]|uniref:Uncharacterized protein n=1 Tax=Tremella mesenterica TaxID=5217 RepID=A0A4Q1BR79_TREME|nr:uncharacterized protein TREMEDRAFT_65384 [Tremella mesenterica DSM 1558]EIW66517.1 hypothetical protein TREMEDRAFT_65384 [Tremella mesenterica DSM 1558]RXK40471.1 hypothetical protein M231_02304 [Tremella mesenterica]
MSISSGQPRNFSPHLTLQPLTFVPWPPGQETGTVRWTWPSCPYNRIRTYGTSIQELRTSAWWSKEKTQLSSSVSEEDLASYWNGKVVERDVKLPESLVSARVNTDDEENQLFGDTALTCYTSQGREVLVVQKKDNTLLARIIDGDEGWIPAKLRWVELQNIVLNDVKARNEAEEEEEESDEEFMSAHSDLSPFITVWTEKIHKSPQNEPNIPPSPRTSPVLSYTHQSEDHIVPLCLTIANDSNLVRGDLERAENPNPSVMSDETAMPNMSVNTHQILHDTTMTFIPSDPIASTSKINLNMLGTSESCSRVNNGFNTFASIGFPTSNSIASTSMVGFRPLYQGNSSRTLMDTSSTLATMTQAGSMAFPKGISSQTLLSANAAPFLPSVSRSNSEDARINPQSNWNFVHTAEAAPDDYAQRLGTSTNTNVSSFNNLQNMVTGFGVNSYRTKQAYHMPNRLSISRLPPRFQPTQMAQFQVLSDPSLPPQSATENGQAPSRPSYLEWSNGGDGDEGDLDINQADFYKSPGRTSIWTPRNSELDRLGMKRWLRKVGWSLGGLPLPGEPLKEGEVSSLPTGYIGVVMDYERKWMAGVIREELRRSEAAQGRVWEDEDGKDTVVNGLSLVMGRWW